MSSVPCPDTNTLTDFACGALDDERRQQVLLHVDTCGACRRLAALAVSTHGAAQGSPGALLRSGQEFGRYVILEPLGVGAMGIVYAAEDRELRRKVALKLVRGSGQGGGGAAMQGRLMREARAAAALSHPNVVVVYEVGEFEGRAFIAMELVEGGTLRHWVAAAPRRTRDTLAMFRQAGEGLAIAHDEGIVHRDFKPDNVLVGPDGRPRVADFGVARHERAAVGDGATSQPDPGADPSMTQPGLLVGTLAYMSPEQLRGETADVRSDQFAFAVSLYEALYGERPFGGVLAGSGNAASPPVRKGKEAVPAAIHAALLRATRIQPEERFADMRSLLHALRDPVVRRRRWLGALGAVAFLAMAAVAVRGVQLSRPPVCPSAAPQLASAWNDTQRSRMATAFRATRKPFAEDALTGTQRTLDEYGAAWIAMHGEACEASLVRGEQSSDLMDLRMECLSARLGEMRALVDQLAEADAPAVERALGATDTLPSLSLCANVGALKAPIGLPHDPALRARIDAVRDRLARARALEQAVLLPEALDEVEHAVAMARESGYAPIEAEALEVKGVVLETAGDDKHAASVLEDAVLAAVRGRHEVVEARAWVDLVLVEADDGRDAEGRDAARHAHAVLDRSPDEERFAELLTAEARIAQQDSKLDEGRAMLDQALAILKRRLSPDHPGIAETQGSLGSLLFAQGHYDEALALAQQALAIRLKAFGPAHPAVARSYNNIANALFYKGDYVGAVAMYRRTLDIRTAAYGPDHRTVADVLQNLGLALTYEKQLDEGLAAEERALQIREGMLEATHPDIVASLQNIAEVLLSMKRWTAVLPVTERAMGLLENTRGPSDPKLAPPLSQRGEALLRLGRTKEAVRDLERALRIAEDNDGEPIKLAGTRHVLALALKAGHGDLARAQRLAIAARAIYAEEPDANAAALRELDEAFPHLRDR